MADVLWKKAEREVARRLGGQRVGCTGRRGADVACALFAIEVKVRSRFPAWLVGALEQAASMEDERVPVVVLHERGQRYDDALVLMRLADFQGLVEGL